MSGILGRKLFTEIKCHSCQITRTRRQCDLPMLILTSSPSRGNVVRFFNCKMWLFCPLFCFMLFGRKWLYTAHPKEWGVVVHPEMEYPHESLGILLHRRFIFFSPFIYSISIYIPMDLWVLILFFGTIIQYCFIYFLAQSVPALAIGSSFSWILCLFDTPNHGVFWTVPYFHDSPGWSCTFQSQP